MNTYLIIEAAKKSQKTLKEKVKPAAQKCHQYARNNPGLIGGAAAGYAAGALIEKIPGVKILLGPLPRIIGLVSGAAFGQAFEQAWREDSKAIDSVTK